MHLYCAPDGVLIGFQDRSDTRLHVCPTDDEDSWREILISGEKPDDFGVAISEEGMAILWDEKERVEDSDEGLRHYQLGEKGRRFVRCALSFREFLNVWNFLDQDAGKQRSLGENLWPGQEEWVAHAAANEWVYFLKARQLGETTIAVAYDAWTLRFRANARVHLVSRTGPLAKDSLLKPLKYGMKRLPPEFDLPETSTTTMSLELDAGKDDRRIAVAYPAKEPGRGETCSHLHLDEWAAMMKTSPELPADVWASAEPTISKEGGTCHILTTGVGPDGFYADTWKDCVSEKGQLFASFIKASGSRPHYTKEWLASKRRSMNDDARFSHEYPETWEDALAGRGMSFFTAYEIDHAAVYARGLIPPIFQRDQHGAISKIRAHGRYVDKMGREHTRRFVKAWDIGGPGEDSDASVGILLDVTEEVWDVRGFVYLEGTSYPETARNIEKLHLDYPGPTYIEDNSAGLAVRQFLTVPDEQVHGWKTTPQSKGPAIRGLKLALGYRLLKWRPEECRVLDTEMRNYKLEDQGIRQDTVMSLAIAVAVGPDEAAATSGRVLRLFDGGLSLN